MIGKICLRHVYHKRFWKHSPIIHFSQKLIFEIFAHFSRNMDIVRIEPIFNNEKKSKKSVKAGVTKALKFLGFATWNELQIGKNRFPLRRTAVRSIWPLLFLTERDIS